MILRLESSDIDEQEIIYVVGGFVWWPIVHVVNHQWHPKLPLSQKTYPTSCTGCWVHGLTDCDISCCPSWRSFCNGSPFVSKVNLEPQLYRDYYAIQWIHRAAIVLAMTVMGQYLLWNRVPSSRHQFSTETIISYPCFYIAEYTKP